MRFLLACLGFLSVFATFLPEAQSATNQLVRVRLMTLEKSKTIQVSGMSLRFQNFEMPYRHVAIPTTGQTEVRLMEKDGKKIWAVKMNPTDREHLFTQKYLLIQGDNMRVGAQTLPTRVLLSPNGSQKIDVVGVMPLEEYVVGVLASEMPLKWPLETLKAQAVATRSYTLSVMKERESKAYHLESTVLDQVYRHVLAEDDKDPMIAKAVQAARETEGETLLSADHKVLKAFYHADCGGQTTTAKNVWTHGVNTGVATDKWCPSNPRAQWSLELSKAELEERLHTHFTKFTTVKESGGERIKEIRIAANDLPERAINANDFRQMLGFENLRSTLFTVEATDDRFVFSGRGFGHGVGLCQWGSRAMGVAGKNYREILQHYYPLAGLLKKGHLIAFNRSSVVL